MPTPQQRSTNEGRNGTMKRLWWTWILVFLLGVGTGKGVQAPTCPEEENRVDVFATEGIQTEPTQPSRTDGPEEGQGGVLPYAFRYTPLVARRLAAYDGPSVEDGADRYLEGAAALVLENTGNTGIEFVQIVLTQQGQKLVFDATYIPPQGTVLIVEKNGTPYSGEAVEAGHCRTLVPGTFDWEKERVRVEERDLGSLAVTNLTDQPISCTRVFYKQHDGEEDVYIGGITYSAVLTDLMPGETRVITPYRYACGYCGIVAVVLD